MRRVNYYIEEQQYQLGTKLAAARGVTLSELLRRSLELYLNGEAKRIASPKKKQRKCRGRE